jgi:predicted DNA-binding protein
MCYDRLITKGGIIMENNTINNNVRTTITLPKELKTRIEALAKQDDRSFNKYVINVLKAHIEAVDKQKNS